MNPKLIIINQHDYDGLEALYTYLDDFEYVAFDLETTGLHKHDHVIGFSVCAEEDKSYYVVIAEFKDEKLHFSSDMDTNLYKRGIMQKLSEKKLICHNAVFDCMMSEYALKQPLIHALHTDTMILAHLLDENRRVGLKDLSASIFKDDSNAESEEMKASVLKNGGKLTKDCYEMWKCDTQIMGKYGAKDAWLTFRLFNHLVPELFEQGLDKFFYEEESMPLLRGPTYDLNTTGLEIDMMKLQELKKTLEAECAELKCCIYNEIKHKVSHRYPGTNKKNTFLISSPQQLSWLLFEVYELEFGYLTKAGKAACRALGMDKIPYSHKAKLEFIQVCKNSPDKKYSNPFKYIVCDKKTLAKYSHEYKWVKYLLEYKTKTKLLTTYVEGIEERIKYGILQPSFLQHGTSSGRYSSRNPNLQNLPRNDQRIKDIIRARIGKVFVSADFSQLEPRVFAAISGDERLCAAFNGKTDFYSVVGIDTYNKSECLPLKEGSPQAFGVMYPKLRQDAKTFALAATYGATGWQLAPMMEKSPDQAQQDIDSYFESFPKVRDMMNERHRAAKKHGFVTSLYGRPRRIPDAKNIDRMYGFFGDLPYQARSLLNLAVNHTIQGTAASIVNRSSIKLWNDLKTVGIEAKMVSQIHDELVLECSEADADNVSILLQNALETTCVLPGNVKLEAIPRITKTLAK